MKKYLLIYIILQNITTTSTSANSSGSEDDLTIVVDSLEEPEDFSVPNPGSGGVQDKQLNIAGEALQPMRSPGKDMQGVNELGSHCKRIKTACSEPTPSKASNMSTTSSSLLPEVAHFSQQIATERIPPLEGANNRSINLLLAGASRIRTYSRKQNDSDACITALIPTLLNLKYSKSTRPTATNYCQTPPPTEKQAPPHLKQTASYALSLFNSAVAATKEEYFRSMDVVEKDAVKMSNFIINATNPDRIASAYKGSIAVLVNLRLGLFDSYIGCINSVVGHCAMIFQEDGRAGELVRHGATAELLSYYRRSHATVKTESKNILDKVHAIRKLAVESLRNYKRNCCSRFNVMIVEYDGALDNFSADIQSLDFVLSNFWPLFLELPETDRLSLLQSLDGLRALSGRGRIAACIQRVDKLRKFQEEQIYLGQVFTQYIDVLDWFCNEMNYHFERESEEIEVLFQREALHYDTIKRQIINWAAVLRKLIDEKESQLNILKNILNHAVENCCDARLKMEIGHSGEVNNH